MHSTSEIKTQTSHFLNLFVKNYSTGSYSLEKVCTIFNRNLDEIKARHDEIKQGYESDSAMEPAAAKRSIKKDIAFLYEIRAVCKLGLAAKEEYDKQHPTDKVGRFFNTLTEKIGIKTDVQQAQTTIDKCNEHIHSLYKNELLKQIDPELQGQLCSPKFIEQAQVHTTLGIMRTCATHQEETVIFSTDDKADGYPDVIYIAKPDGDVFTIDCKQSIDKEEGFHFFKGKKYPLHGNPVEVQFISSYSRPEAKGNGSVNHAGGEKEAIAQVNRRMKESQELLINGVTIETQKPVSVQIESQVYAFAPIESQYHLGAKALMEIYARIDARREAGEGL